MDLCLPTSKVIFTCPLNSVYDSQEVNTVPLVLPTRLRIHEAARPTEFILPSHFIYSPAHRLESLLQTCKQFLAEVKQEAFDCSEIRFWSLADFAVVVSRAGAGEQKIGRFVIDKTDIGGLGELLGARR